VASLRQVIVPSLRSVTPPTTPEEKENKEDGERVRIVF